MREEFSRAVAGVASQARMEVESLASGFGSDLERMYGLVEEVALLRKEKEEIQSLIGPARVLMCVLESPDALRHVPISVVFQLLDRIGLWSERILPEGRFRVNLDFASEKLCSSSTGAFSITVESLVKVTTEALQMQLARSDRERNSVMR